MTINLRRAVLTFGAVTAGLLAATFLPIAVGAADEYDFTPDLTTFAPTQAEGYPPLINEVTGAEKWGLSDATTNTVRFPDVLNGADTETTIGSFTNDDYLTNAGIIVVGPSSSFLVSSGTQIDIANFGLGFGNEWLDVPSGANSGISDLFITPFGDFEVLGSAFSTLLS